MPIKDVAYVVNLKKPDYLYSHLTSVGQNFNFDRFLTNLRQKFQNIPVIISGQLTQNFEKKIQPPILFKRSFAEVMQFVTNL